MEFKQGYDPRAFTIKGNPKGTFAEKEEFIRFLLNNSKADDKPELFQEFLENFPCDITRKYLKVIALKDGNFRRKERRINKFLKDSKNILDVRNGVPEYNGLIPNEVEDQRNFVNGNIFGKSINEQLILSIPEFNKRQLELNENGNMLFLNYEKLKEEAKLYEEQQLIKEQRRQLQLAQEYIIKFTCSECQKEILFPILPNIDTDKYQEKVGDIYKICQENIRNGTKLCMYCELKAQVNGGWKKERARQELQRLFNEAQKDPEIVEHEYVSLPIDVIEFCEEYRLNKIPVSMNKISRFLNSFIANKEVDDYGIRFIYSFYNIPESNGKTMNAKEMEEPLTWRDYLEGEGWEPQRYEKVRAGKPELILEAMKWLQTKEPAVEIQQGSVSERGWEDAVEIIPPFVDSEFMSEFNQQKEEEGWQGGWVRREVKKKAMKAISHRLLNLTKPTQ